MLNIGSYDQDELHKFLQRRHPEYSEMLGHWKFCELTYKGGREWFEHGNIFRYIKEGDEEYDDRVARAYRTNHTREVVDLIDKYIFKSDVARNWGDAPDYVKNFWRNATLSGLEIGQLMRMLSTKSSIKGRIWVFVDSNKSQAIISKADEGKAGARVYAYVVDPEDMLDVGFEEDGSIGWMLVRERKRDDSNPIKATGIVQERYRLWTKDAWYLFQIDDNADLQPIGKKQPPPITSMAGPVQHAFEQLSLPGVTPYIQAKDVTGSTTVHLIDQGPVTIGRVPCFPLDHVIGDNKYCAPSLVGDIAYLDRAVANYLSNLDAIIQDQTFSQLAMPAQNILPGDDKYEQIRQMGTKRIFTYDGEGGTQPFYLSPDPKQAQIVVEVVNKIIAEIYHSVGMGTERTKQDNSVGIDNSSGVAKAYDFERLNSLLVTKSEALENAENHLLELVALWNGAKVNPIVDTVTEKDKTLVEYADTFDVRSLYDEFTVAERLTIMDAPKTVRQEQMKLLIDKLFPKLKDDLKQAMLKDLKSWPITGIDQVAIQGVLDGNPSAQFPARLKTTENPGMKPAPQPESKNPQTANRQGQVTSKTK